MYFSFGSCNWYAAYIMDDRQAPLGPHCARMEYALGRHDAWMQHWQVAPKGCIKHHAEPTG